MVLSYARLLCPLEDAMARYGRWIASPEVAPPQLVPERDKLDLALADDEWLGLAVFIYMSGAWTVIEELSGGLGARPAGSWLELAQDGDLVYASYNDAINYAEIVVVQNGKLVRQFLDDEQDPGDNVDVGQLPEEGKKRIKDWIDATSWVETDELQLIPPEQGWLWIHRAPPSDAEL